MLELTNTMGRRREVFRPRFPADRRSAAGEDGGRTVVKIFTCGPSVYRRPHIGNYRTFLFEDVLVRYLEHLGYSVQRVINFTDVEDKTIREAARQGTDLKHLTGPVEESFFRETALLRIKLPPFIPRSSTCVPEAVRLIRVLLERGYAYWHDGDVFFDPLKYPGFGRLFGLDMSRWPKKKVRFRLDTYPGQQWNRGDFVLWHGRHEEDGAAWETEIGRGRPSWNVQDPAMILQTLGPAIDIHCGGIDNIWRHHDYTIAVTEAATGQELAPWWLHGAHLVVGGRPMSKSRGNILYPEDVLQPPWQARHLRFFLIDTHYRRRLSYTPDRFHRSAERLEGFRSLAARLLGAGTPQHPRTADGAPPAGFPDGAPAAAFRPDGAGAPAGVEGAIGRIVAEFEAGMDGDLAVGSAFDRVRDLLAGIDRTQGGAPLPPRSAARLRGELERVDGVLQVLDLGRP